MVRAKRAFDFNDEYKGILKSSYGDVKTQEDTAKRFGFVRDKKLSTRNTQVLYKNGRAYMVHRGTAHRSDWIDDGLLAVGAGFLSSRVRHAKRIRSNLKSNGFDSVVHAGHSLGGELSRITADKLDETHVYNPHTIGYTTRRFTPNDYTYRTPGDVASLPLVMDPMKYVRSIYSNNLQHVGSNNLSSWFHPLKAHSIPDTQN